MLLFLSRVVFVTSWLVYKLGGQAEKGTKIDRELSRLTWQPAACVADALTRVGQINEAILVSLFALFVSNLPSHTFAHLRARCR